MADVQEVNKVGDDGKFEVTVNDKPVVLEGAKQTGASVKKAAIEQGVEIKEDFVLSIELGGGKTDLVGDGEEIVVHEHERFLAIENDDNS
ncbi:MAG: multiubiquitin domain-containing protein [Gammaproteobacteria bacterium]|nr:multiubiquitin domain-containing protein [Gammaproteobacteria bacterium]